MSYSKLNKLKNGIVVDNSFIEFETPEFEAWKIKNMPAISIKFDDLDVNGFKNAIEQFRIDRPKYKDLSNAEIVLIIKKMNWSFNSDGTIYKD